MTVLNPRDCDYILGNPPFRFLGSNLLTNEQNHDIKTIFKGVSNSGILDYVYCWFMKASKYIAGSKIKVSFVSTNSITQGQQVAVLWNQLLESNITINFAYKTFVWSNKAK